MATREQILKWDAWERRNPGVAHPDRIADRNAKGRKAKAEDYMQGTDRFARPMSFTERARQARGQAPRLTDPEKLTPWSEVVSNMDVTAGPMQDDESGVPAMIDGPRRY